MITETPAATPKAHFDQQYQTHLKHLKLKGLQPKTIDAFSVGFLAQYRDKLSSGHMQALAAMRRCRTEASAKMQVQCTGCVHQTLVPQSCGHRHCPHCQHHESQQWLELQLKRLVPAEYFLITFTLPAKWRPLAWAHQGVV